MDVTDCGTWAAQYLARQQARLSERMRVLSRNIAIAGALMLERVLSSLPKEDPEKLAALLEALAERAEAAPDQEIIDDAVAAGIDVKAEASRIGDLLADAVLRAKKQRLASAGDAHARSLAALGQRAARLPTTPAAKKALLGRVLRQQARLSERMRVLSRNIAIAGALMLERVLSSLGTDPTPALLGFAEPEDARALAEFVRDAVAKARPTVVRVRVEYTCNRNGSPVSLAHTSDSVGLAYQFAARLGSGARTCDSLDRIVHVLEVEVTALRGTKEGS